MGRRGARWPASRYRRYRGAGGAGGPAAGGLSGPASGFGMIEPMLASACVTSLGMIQTLFDSPCAICGRVWRYW